MPDILGVSIKELMQRVDQLEDEVKGHKFETHHHIHTPVLDDAWEGIDFAI